ncbi:hypothetical protein CC86DRAFT_383397 [Ophiobolus disseminans]|uniref:Uncharacterized protein n=1 Tax=Ophiobolus disseminans TaxID=1469910 RepID=A0A6A6ZWU8_9PLEO|nr:hypothetical protein CC86DRAFT_383397 [Ophiobolus disseminans]
MLNTEDGASVFRTLAVIAKQWKHRGYTPTITIVNRDDDSTTLLENGQASTQLNCLKRKDPPTTTLNEVERKQKCIDGVTKLRDKAQTQTRFRENIFKMVEHNILETQAALIVMQSNSTDTAVSTTESSHPGLVSGDLTVPVSKRRKLDDVDSDDDAESAPRNTNGKDKSQSSDK